MDLFEPMAARDHEQVIAFQNNATGLRGFPAIHDTTPGGEPREAAVLDGRGRAVAAAASAAAARARVARAARVLRLMREAQLLGPSRTVPKAENPHTGTIIPERPNEVWATDNTATVTVDAGSVTVFVSVDHCTTECVGIHAAKRATRFEALEPIRQGVRDYCGGFAAGAA